MTEQKKVTIKKVASSKKITNKAKTLSKPKKTNKSKITTDIEVLDKNIKDSNAKEDIGINKNIDTKKDASKNVKNTNKDKSSDKAEVGNITPNEQLKKVMLELKTSKDGVIVMADGKTYTKISERVKKVREEFGFDIKIISVIKELTKETAWAEAQLWLRRDTVWELIQTANAYEEKSTGVINKTSYVEVAETSAVGRCLGFIGLFGDEFASTEELINSLTASETSKQKSATRRSSTANKVLGKPINEQQISSIYDFLNKNKNYSVENILDGKKDLQGKRASKIEDLSFKDADIIINIMNIDADKKSPLSTNNDVL